MLLQLKIYKGYAPHVIPPFSFPQLLWWATFLQFCFCNLIEENQIPLPKTFWCCHYFSFNAIPVLTPSHPRVRIANNTAYNAGYSVLEFIRLTNSKYKIVRCTTPQLEDLQKTPKQLSISLYNPIRMPWCHHVNPFNENSLSTSTGDTPPLESTCWRNSQRMQSSTNKNSDRPHQTQSIQATPG